ncbi:MAG: putative nucleotidyltransferase with HDIG domain [Myxococcota bacterium]|jgi:putative nucleotidyltransferase with HDIG domain
MSESVSIWSAVNFPLKTEQELVADVSALVSPPALCVKVFSLIQSPNASASEIGELVALDPNITARLLKIVNSSYYGLPSQVDTLQRAVTLLGTRDLYNLVLAISAVRSFSAIGAGLVSIERFWCHSVYVGLMAREIAKRIKLREPDRLFVIGLLHDIGSPVIYAQLPELLGTVAEPGTVGEDQLAEQELQLLGFEHASVAACLLETWQIPAPLRNAIRHHHNPESAAADIQEAAVLCISDRIASASIDGQFFAGSHGDATIDPMTWDALGASPDVVDIDSLLEQTAVQFQQTIGALIHH